ncbi:UNVERIFIED_CONTAM: hypothetical protein GTU68_026880 [Idotea baltica]|nr:hypothetical protein [Idotea baltica]
MNSTRSSVRGSKTADSAVREPRLTVCWWSSSSWPIILSGSAPRPTLS